MNYFYIDFTDETKNSSLKNRLAFCAKKYLVVILVLYQEVIKELSGYFKKIIY